jgi:8-oxo-dGTP pyrophosphatase MutT (NUDIX family)
MIKSVNAGFSSETSPSVLLVSSFSTSNGGIAMQKLFKYGLAIIDNGKLLVQKEVDQELYLMPGGRPEESETIHEALAREIKEELGSTLDLQSLKLFGSFEDEATGREDTVIEGVSELLICYPVWVSERNGSTHAIASHHDHPSTALPILPRDQYRQTWHHA